MCFSLTAGRGDQPRYQKRGDPRPYGDTIRAEVEANIGEIGRTPTGQIRKETASLSKKQLTG